MLKLQPKLDGVPQVAESGATSTEDSQLDAIIVQIGQFGRFQITNYLLLCLPIICNAFYSISYIFTASNVAHRCNITQCDSSDSSYSAPFLNFTTPQSRGAWDQCQHYALSSEIETASAACNESNFNQSELIICEAGFKLVEDERTIASEFGIFCGDQWKLSMVGTVNNIGQFVGIPLGGYLADRLRQIVHALGWRIAQCCFVWFTHTFIALGLSLNSSELKGSKFENFSMMGFMQLPGSLLATVIMHRIGRRWALTSCMTSCTLFLLAVPALQEAYPVTSSVLYFMAKMTSTGSFVILYFFTSEIFPTNCRNSLLSFCSMVGRFGSMLAPQTPLLIPYYTYAPHFLFALFGFVCACLTLYFPETTNKALPTTLEEARSLDRSMPKPLATKSAV
ncbi:GL25415 [Drosophila persimilis]|uniref:GL25415 n=1 Tax=Drosophila persimilis TaxID=7234 RepID=B4H8Q4_DROPE|nr:GL25415 [Drosophila persimilis]